MSKRPYFPSFDHVPASSQPHDGPAPPYVQQCNSDLPASKCTPAARLLQFMIDDFVTALLKFAETPYDPDDRYATEVDAFQSWYSYEYMDMSSLDIHTCDSIPKAKDQLAKQLRGESKSKSDRQGMMFFMEETKWLADRHEERRR